MTPLILRVLGAVAGLGSSILCWFLGHALGPPLKQGHLFALDRSHYALLAFLFVPALILASVALFWVPPRISGEGSLPEGRLWRTVLVLIFLVTFLVGIFR